MKTIVKTLFLCGIIVLTTFSCEKEEPEVIELLVELVNENNEVIDTFEKDDSVFFNFYLINNIGREVSYMRPIGDTLILSIDSERHQFESRLYFTINTESHGKQPPIF